MAIDFPNSPTNGQTYTVGSRTWTYDSANGVWNATSVTLGPQGIQGTQGIQGFGYQQLQGIQGIQGTTGISSYTTSAQLLTAISDETGTGALVFANTPTLVTPVLGNATATSIVATVASGTTVPLTIQNNGTGNSFVVNDEASDTTPFIVDASGNVGIGSITPTIKLEIFDSTSAWTRLMGDSITNSEIRRASNDATSAALFLQKRRGTTAVSTNVVADDNTGRLIFTGYEGTGDKQNASIYSFIEGTVSTGIVPGRLVFNTTNSAGTVVERMRIDSAGLITAVGTISANSTIELGHATDTTLARVSAGVVSIEGVNIVTTSSTDTLTNKTLTSPVITNPKIACTYTAKTAAYTFVSGDEGNLFSMNNAATQAFTVPTDATFNFAVGTEFNVFWITGAGQPTIAAVTPGTTAVISTGATSATPKLRVVNSGATIKKIAANSWIVFGDIS